MTLDTAAVAAAIEACAREIVMPAFHDLETLEVGLKGPNDYVTAADVASEAFLTPRLMEMLPGSVVVGEETAGEEAVWRETLRTARAAWLIDPIDGTANFAAGIPLFGIIVALVENGETTHSWVHDPNTGEMGIAVRGEGAHIDGRPPAVSSQRDATKMRGSLNLAFAEEHHAASLFKALRRMPPVLEPRCVVQSYLYLASGRTDFALFHKMYPWDHAAGVLLHQEAGGHVRHFDGTAYAPHRQPFGNPLLVAPSEAGWRDLRNLLFPVG